MDPDPYGGGDVGSEPFAALLAAAQAGAGWAFSELWTLLSPAVAGYLRGHGAGEPEDLTSEVFLAAFTRIGSFTGDEGGFRSWVFTIAHHRLVDELRRRARRGVPEQYDPAVHDQPAVSAEEEALVSVGTAEVVDRLALLSPDQRDVLLLRVVGDLTVEQVAQVTGKRVGAVKALQRRALAALRKSLEEAVPV